MFRIWLDDVRKMPPGYDVHCRTAAEAKKVILEGVVTFISFDHDLGEGNGTGYDVACFIEMLVWEGVIRMPSYKVHSANPVGERNIHAAMKKALDYKSN